MKKQILKTSVLAAVLLSMGAAHADILTQDIVTVKGSVGVPTCQISVDKNVIDIGRKMPVDFVTAGADRLVGAQDVKVTLADCPAAQAGGNDAKTIDLQVSGPVTAAGNTYFGNPDAVANNVAVGVEADGAPGVLLENDSVIEIRKGGDPWVAVDQTYKVGLIAKTPAQVIPGSSVSAPLTFKLVTK